MMYVKYCMHCGKQLSTKYIEKEGDVAHCVACDTLFFPQFNTAVSMIALNPAKDQILLIQQYGKQRNVLVAGYVNQKEDVEETLIREMKEEIGRNICAFKYLKSEYFVRSNTLMLSFAVVLDDMNLDFVDQDEIDCAQWFSFEKAKKEIAKDSLAERFLNHFIQVYHDDFFEEHDKIQINT